MSEFDLYLYLLLIANALTYGFLAYWYFKPRIRMQKTSQVNVAFSMLEDALTRSFPDLPAGFTWSEGIARAKALKLNIRWGEVNELLMKYEAHRYGVLELPEGNPHEVLKLAYSLPRRPKIGRRSES